MTKGVFIYQAGSQYEDDPTVHYQFPSRLYLSRASQLVDDWVVYLESRRGGKRGYFAAAKVQSVVPDPTAAGMHLALMEPGSFIEFDNHVPFSDQDGPAERGLLNERGEVSGRKRSAVRPLAEADFARIVSRGLADETGILPRLGDMAPAGVVREDKSPFAFEIERDRVSVLTSRPIRDRAFRRNVLAAYDSRCALSRLKLINGGGRAEVEAAHIRPVEHGGPDAVANGLALSGTAHWMFDRGLITLEDDLQIKVSRHVNDVDSVWHFIHPSRRSAEPIHQAYRPHPHFLRWHRENVFKV